jgi:hypothetical protein
MHTVAVQKMPLLNFVPSKIESNNSVITLPQCYCTILRARQNPGFWVDCIRIIVEVTTERKVEIPYPNSNADHKILRSSFY